MSPGSPGIVPIAVRACCIAKVADCGRRLVTRRAATAFCRTERCAASQRSQRRPDCRFEVRSRKYHGSVHQTSYAFLFGAGASFGAGEISPGPPPLGAQLYDALRREYPETWGKLVRSDEDEAFRDVDTPFEKGMGLVWERRDQRAQVLISDMAIYFTRFEPGGMQDSYSRLLKLLILRNLLGRSTFATLNYDCIFEYAANRLGLGVNYHGRRGTAQTVPVIKPHGSCNFVMRGLGTDIVMEDVVMSGMGAFYEGPIQARPPREIPALYSKGPSMPPAISLYCPGKPSPMAPTFLARLRSRWQEACEAADVVVVIGARVVLDDQHVWGHLLKNKCEVWYVGEPVGTDFSTFEARLGTRLIMWAPRFDAAIPRLDARLRLVA